MAKLNEEKKVFLVLLLAIAAAIYAGMDIMQQIQADIFPRITSFILLVFALLIIYVLLPKKKKKES